MKNAITIAATFILLFPFSGYSQEGRFQQLLDSTYYYLEMEQPDKCIAAAYSALDVKSDLLFTPAERSQCYTMIARAHKSKNEFSPSLEFYLQALKEMEKLNNSNQIAEIEIEIGQLFAQWEVYERALEYYFKVYTNRATSFTIDQKIDLLKLISYASSLAGNYKEAEIYYDSLLQLAEVHRKNELKSILIDMADLHSNNHDYNKALKYELDILELQKADEDTLSMITSLNNIGYLYSYLNQRFRSLEYFTRSLELSKLSSDPQILINSDVDVVLINIATINTSMANFDEALKYLYEALQIRVQKNRVRGTAEIYNEIATIYYKQEDLRNAENYAQSSILISKRVNAIDILAKSYKLLSDIYTTNGESDRALEYYKKYVSAKDQLFVYQNKQEQELQKKQALIENKERELKLLLIDKEIKDLALKELQLETEKKEIDLTLLRQEKALQDITLKHQQAEKEKTEQELALTQEKYNNELKAKEIAVLQKNDSIQTLVINQNELQRKEKQREIEFLQQSRELQQLELERANILIYIFAIGFIIFITFIFLIYRGYRVKRKANLKLSKQNLEIQIQKDEIENQKDKMEIAFQNLKSAQAKLIQSEKMASLGILTAGIAHEINNPINFVYAGIDGLRASLSSMADVLKKYEQLDQLEDIESCIRILHEIKVLKEELYFEDTKTSITELINAIKEGASRTAQIVNGLRNFSRLDETELKSADVHIGIDSTLLLLNSKINKESILVKKDYNHNLGKISCYPGQLNQVFMNILSNAIEAVDKNGTIIIRTENDQEKVVISFIDNGIGMDEMTMNKIFEPFFTTKDLGKGTGLGMSISFGIIERHNGQIEVESNVGEGTTIRITLPKFIPEKTAVMQEVLVSDPQI